MKAVLALTAFVLVLAGCDKTPATGGAGVGLSTGQEEAETLNREKSQAVTKTDEKQVQVPVAQLIFIPDGADALGMQRSIARKGAGAIKQDGQWVDVGEVLKAAVRPVIAWPVSPLDDSKGAKRWASTMAAAVDVADLAAQELAEKIPARFSQAEQVEAAMQSGWDNLDRQALSQAFKEASQRPVTLDLTGGDVRFLSGGKAYTFGPNGGSSSTGGVVQFNPAAGVIGGKTYRIAVGEAAVQQIKRASTQLQSTSAGNSKATNVTTGVK